MAKATIRPGQLQGSIAIPPSKSHTLRALLFALLADGKSQIDNYLHSPDTAAMIDAIRQLGAEVEITNDQLTVQGTAGRLKPADDVIQCGNSGQVLRFIGALSALLPTYTILTGDTSIRHHRPIKPLLDALHQLGATALSSRLDGYAPIIIQGPLKGGHAELSGEDSQPVSALLIAGALTPLELTVTRPGEKPWIDLTLSWLDRLGIPYQNDNYEHYRTEGRAKIKSFSFQVPGDFSSAAFPLAAALITQSEITLHGVDMKDVQGDKAIIPLLQSMGAQIETEGRSLHVKKSTLQGTRIDINNLIDALPILAVIGCFASGTTEIINGAIARKKESDRIHCMATELKKMGAHIDERPDGLLIHHSPLHGTELQTYQDHRLVMALSVAALAAKGASTLHGIESAAKSYPTFFSDLRTLNTQLDLHS